MDPTPFTAWGPLGAVVFVVVVFIGFEIASRRMSSSERREERQALSEERKAERERDRQRWEEAQSQTIKSLELIAGECHATQRAGHDAIGDVKQALRDHTAATTANSEALADLRRAIDILDAHHQAERSS